MRKIDKSKILSTQYKKWLDNLEKLNKKHPCHSHSRKKHYIDVAMNLLHCQKGVCAYTEKHLCDDELLAEEEWMDGKYKNKKPGIKGELEHFDHNLKKEKFWLWDNLFFCDERTNRLKKVKEIDKILKPDSPEYDPMTLLEYEKDIHVFRPHSNIEKTTKRERIQRMIDALQINSAYFRRARKRYFKQLFINREYNTPFDHYQFFTAYTMIEEELKEEE